MLTKTRGVESFNHPYSAGSSYVSVYEPNDERKDEILYQALILAQDRVYNRQGTGNAGTITYENDFAKMNYCHHEYDKYTYHGEVPFKFLRVGTANWKGVPIDAQVFAGSASYNPMKPTSLPETVVTEEMRKRAWAKIQPELNTGFSMANFLWEIKEIPQLIRQAGKLISAFRNMEALLGGVRNLDGKTPAQIQLTYAYAISPLISDFSSIYDDLLNTEKRVNEFIAKGRKIEPYHYREKLSDTDEEVGGTNWGECRCNKKVHYYATAWISYSYRKPSVFDGFRRVMGLRLTPEAIWNSIPYSFLIDYLVNISDCLRQLDKDPNITVKIHGYCDTIKSEAVNYEVRTKSSYYASGNIAAGFEVIDFDSESRVWSWSATEYKRTPGMPSTGYAFPVFDSLSKRELVLAGALAHTNLL